MAQPPTGQRWTGRLSRHAATLALVATHVFVVYTAIESGWKLATVTWLYWCGGFFFAATVFWRMINSRAMDLAELFAWFFGFWLLQSAAFILTKMSGGPLPWDQDFGLALLGIFTSQCLELRGARAVDREDPPALAHFGMLGMARFTPLALMVAFQLAFEGWLDRSPFTYLMVFLLTIAVADIVLQVRGRHIGRTFLPS